jgi:hypothetical protein
VATAVPGFPVIQWRPGAPFQSTLKQLSLLRSPGSNCVSPCSIPKILLSEDFVPGPLFLEAFRSTDFCRSYIIYSCAMGSLLLSPHRFLSRTGVVVSCVCVCVCGSVGTENL